MKKYIPLVLLGFLLGYTGQLEGQRITRSTLSSLGGTQVSPNVRVSSTFGSCPGCKSQHGSTGIIREGFQQPSSNSNDNQDCFTVAFENEILSDNCGVSFNFEYTGDGNTENATFEWDFGQDAAPPTSNEQNPQGIIYTSSGAKMVTLRVVIDDCDVSASQTMTVGNGEQGFAATYEATELLCAGAEDGSIRLETSGGTEPYSYIWSDGDENQNRTDLIAGEYGFTITDATGCSFSDVVSISEADSIRVDPTITEATSLDSIMPDGAIDLVVSGGAEPYSYAWSDGSVSPTRPALGFGEYTVTITDGNGCSSTFTYFVNVKSPGTGGVGTGSTVFTPNADNINDVWIVDGIEEFPENDLQIFNRWGSVVYTESGYNNTWRGTNNEGVPLPSGAYFYLIELNDADNRMLSGSVTIVR